MLTQSVKMWTLVSEIVAEIYLRLSSVLLLIRPCDWITMTKDEMYFVCAATLIWTEHNGVRRGVTELALKSQSQHC